MLREDARPGVLGSIIIRSLASDARMSPRSGVNGRSSHCGRPVDSAREYWSLLAYESSRRLS